MINELPSEDFAYPLITARKFLKIWEEDLDEYTIQWLKEYPESIVKPVYRDGFLEQLEIIHKIPKE